MRRQGHDNAIRHHRQPGESGRQRHRPIGATDPFSGPFVENIRLAATRKGVKLGPILISDAGEFETAFAAMAKANAQAVIIQPLFDPDRAILLELARKHQLALMSNSRETAAAGGVMSISADFTTLYERAAQYVDRIIKGATGQSTGGATHEIPDGVERESGALARADGLTGIARPSR